MSISLAEIGWAKIGDEGVAVARRSVPKIGCMLRNKKP